MARGASFFGICTLCLLAASAAHGDDTFYSHGTSQVILMSPDTIVAAADSRNTSYAALRDGTAVRDNSERCNLRRLDGIIAMAAGLSRVGDFDTLDTIDTLYRPGDSVRTVAARVRDAIPPPLLTAIQELRRSLNGRMDGMRPANQVTLEVAIMGPQDGAVAIDVVTFRFGGTDMDPQITSSEFTCPGDCPAGHAAIYLGVHDSIDRIIGANPDLGAQPTPENVRLLAGLEYLNHPDTVGGELSVLKIERSGIMFLQPGACGFSDTVTLQRVAPKAGSSMKAQTRDAELFGAELSDRLEAIPDLIVHEVATRHARQGHRIQTDVVEAEVQIVGDEQAYSAISRNGRPCATMSDIPGAWADGGLATILQVTRSAIQSRVLSSVSRITASGAHQLGIAFDVPSADHIWSITIGDKRYSLDLQGTVWIDQTTGKLAEIHWQSSGGLVQAAEHITGITWGVTFAPVSVAGKQYDIPETSTYRINFDNASGRTDWIDTRFSGFRRFGASSNISFE